MRRWLATAAVAVAVAASPVAAQAQSPAPERPFELEPGQTVVSMSFDDGYKGQEMAARILADKGVRGTFYVNSGTIGYPAFLTVEQLRGIAAEGHEVGGHSVDHERLAELPLERVEAEVCDDRATLAALGFEPRSFAYPHGSDSREVRSVVQRCGYSSARDTAGLYDSPQDCGDCPKAENLVDVDSWRIRTNETSTELGLLQQRVTQAEQAGGGWLVLVFHHVCTCPEKGENSITPADFAVFVDWLTARAPRTRTATVAEVAGGPLRPVVGTPVERLVDPGGGSRTEAVAFTVGGVGIGQAQVIATGMLLTVLIVVGYRYGTRGNRYAQRTR